MARGYHFTDLLIAGCGLAFTTLLLLAWATRVDVQVARTSATLAQMDARRATAEATLVDVERRAGEDAVLRQIVARRVEDLQARFPAQFSRALGEASRARPKGVWLTRFYWTGADVKAEGQTWGPAPMTEFAGRLARSPHFAQVFTAPSASGGSGPARFLLFARAVAK